MDHLSYSRAEIVCMLGAEGKGRGCEGRGVFVCAHARVGGCWASLGDRVSIYKRKCLHNTVLAFFIFIIEQKI